MNDIDWHSLAVRFGELALKFLTLIFVTLLPIHSVMVAIFCLVLADFVTGIIASIYEKRKITSSKMRRTIVKLVVYQFGVIFAFILETYIMKGAPAVNTLAGLIGLVEGKSFFENFKRITGIDLWTEFLSRLNMQDVKLTDKPEDKK